MSRKLGGVRLPGIVSFAAFSSRHRDAISAVPSNDIGFMSCAAALRIEQGTIRDARLALGGVAHKPWRDTSVEASLSGQTANRAAFTAAAERLLRDAKGYAHNAFKIDLARRVIVRALTQAASGTPQSQSSKFVR